MSQSVSETAWSFLVVSDRGQIETLPDQRSWAEGVARQNGWKITRIFQGVSSGRDGIRGQTRAMIHELERMTTGERPARVLMIRVDRLGRGNGLEAVEAFTLLHKLGVTIHTREDGDIRHAKAAELIPPILRIFVGGFENDNRRDKLLSHYERRRAANAENPLVATTMRPPYGLAYDKGMFVPKSPEDEAVRLAYELRGQCLGFYAIAKKLAVVAPPMTLKTGAIRPQHWDAERVSRLIKNKNYRGTLIDGAIWDRAQLPARQVSRPTRRMSYALSAALTCECGRALVGGTGSRVNGQRSRYYQCRNMAAHQGRYRCYQADHLEQQFGAILVRLRADGSLIRHYIAAGDTQNEVKALEARIASHRRELDGLDERRRSVHASLEEKVLSAGEARWRFKDLSELEERLRAELREMTEETRIARTARATIESIRQLINSAKDIWENAAIDDQKALAKAFAGAFGGLTVRVDGILHLGPIARTGDEPNGEPTDDE